MGKAEVPYDSTLIIEAGVTVKLLSSTDFADFDYNTLDVGLLKVYGKIIAEGNENDSIIFTRTGDGNWGSVSFLNYSEEPNAVKFCHVSYGHYIYTEAGIIFDGGITFNGANAIIKSLTREGFKILNISDTTRIPRGGPKKKGGRRGRRV